jgi:hypothetical protein
MYLLFDTLIVYLSVSFIFYGQITSKASVECEKEINNYVQMCKTNITQLECKLTASRSHSSPRDTGFKCCAFYQFDECLTERLDSVKNRECKQLKDTLKLDQYRRSLDFSPVCLKAGYTRESQQCEQLINNIETTQGISCFNGSSVLQIESIFLILIIFKALNLFIH